MIVKCIGPISEIDGESWDSLTEKDNPFTTHAFLASLEACGAVSPETGWQPVHMVVEEDSTIVAAAPLYIKGHSYGEYIFDWGWAEASERAGLPYYPKLLCAVPFTPATGRRFLTGSTTPERAAELQKVLWSGIRALAKSINASSIHALFTTEKEANNISHDNTVLHRLTHQFHWTRPEVGSFEEWLSLFRSKDRKKIRRERQKAQSSVDEIRVLHGAELDHLQIATIWEFYKDTCSRKWGQVYLDYGFFESLRTTLASLTRVFLAYKNKEIVASSLCFEKGSHLYGRYWGCKDTYDSLHFELCYHQPIEYCIDRGLSRFEAGAQGIHKVKRGLMPSVIHSLHWLSHPGLYRAVESSLEHERMQILTEIDILSERGPFRRDTSLS